DPLRRGLEAAIGQAVVPRYHFDRAKYIVSIDCDFLRTYLSPVEFARDFSRTRLPETGEMSRFVAFESLTSLTGFNADDRFRIRPSQQTLVAMGLAHEIVSKGRSGFAGNSQVK